MNTPNQSVPRCGPRDKQAAHCCFIGCDRPATKHIYTEPWAYDNYTHSCDEHVEELKSTENDVVEELIDP